MARRKRKARFAKYGKIDGRWRFGLYKRKYNELLVQALQGVPNLLVTAYHEAAHAYLIKYGQNNIDILDRVTIIPQDGNLGVTFWHDVQESYTDEQLFAQIVQFMGGRAVELLMFHNAQGRRTGCGRCTSCGNSSNFLELREMEPTDELIANLIQQATDTATQVLRDNERRLKRLVIELIGRKTLTDEQIDKLFRRYRPRHH